MIRPTTIFIAILSVATAYILLKLDYDDARVTAANSRIQQLEQAINAENQDKIQELGSEFDKVLPHFDPNEKGYTKLESGLGNFLVICDNVEKYSNGYKLHLRIGNPNYIIFRNSVMSVLYGDDLKSVRSTIPYMRPGTWTTFDVVMAPAVSDDLNKIKLQLATSDILLIKDYPIIPQSGD